MKKRPYDQAVGGGDSKQRAWTRRGVLGAALAASGPLVRAASAAAAKKKRKKPAAAPPKPLGRKIKLGLVGCGGRGSWIIKLFQKHGGYRIHAVADYFQPVADKCGDALSVDKSRRFSGLSGYRKLIASGAEAVALETPPYFFPEHAAAAVEAGLHVYMAKPVAVDVPGCLLTRSLGKQATQKKRCFLVDYQIPTDPINIEVRKRILAGGLGKVAYMQTTGFTRGFPDPPKTATIESRLQRLVWVNDVALGCDLIGNFDIHAIDAAVWVAGAAPVSAAGASRICRPNAHGDSRDICQVVFEFADGVILNHTGQALRNNSDKALNCQVYGQVANAMIEYWARAYVRGGPKHYGGGVVQNLYQAGAVRNIETFYRNVTEGRCDNPTVRRAVDGCLTAILGREAAAQHVRLTMKELIKANRRLEVDLGGLKT